MSCPATSLCVGDLCGGGGISSGRWCFGAPSRRHHHYTHPPRAFPDDDYSYSYSYDEDDYYYAATTTTGGRGGGWRGLWRRLVRRTGGPSRRRTPSPPSSSSVGWGRGTRSAAAAPYDPYTYAQNFDDGGWEWAEPEDMGRSFSSRYADPSAVVRAVGTVPREPVAG